MKILWKNIPARLWLLRHDRHSYKDLTGSVWWCSCGSVYMGNLNLRWWKHAFTRGR